MYRWNWPALACGVAAVAVVVDVAAQTRGDAMASLVAAERAFARMSVLTSQRDAFLANFADEGVWFALAPSRTKADLQKQSAPAGPPTRVLDWEPVTGDVAASGDLGYTTGPWLRRERTAGGAPGKTLGTGWFFSVWEWRGGGGWKVVADFGVDVQHDGALRATPFSRAQVRGEAPKDPGTAKTLADELTAADVAFARQVTAAGWSEAVRRTATEDVRVLRDGQAPTVGRDAVARLFPPAAHPLTVEAAFARASSAGDLGYSYGAYTATPGQRPVRGYYLHVWKRRADRWKLAVDVANEEPPAKR